MRNTRRYSILQPHPAAEGRGHPARRHPRGAAEAGDGTGRVEAAAQGSGHDL